MATEISKGLKWTFFIHFVVTLLFGVVFTMLVTMLDQVFDLVNYLKIIGWPYFDPVISNLLGFAFFALALSSFIAWKETKWEKVKIIVLMEIAWFMGGTYVMFWSLYSGMMAIPGVPELPPMGWIYLIMFSTFLIAFIVFYIQHEKEKKESD